ncbi:glycoside hydrolase family 3 protein [Fusibacter sp. JL298sf-3]
MKIGGIGLLWAVLLLILSGCQSADVKVPLERVVDVHEASVDVSPPPEPTIEQRVEARLEAMTLAEKVAQLFIVTPEALGGNTSKTAFDEALSSGLGTYPVGGLIYFSGNIESPEQIQAMTGAVRTYADAHDCVPFFQSVDEEGGVVARIGNHEAFDVSVFENMASIGATGDVKAAFAVGEAVGTYLSYYGFNLDFAPVADVLTESRNRVIGTRAFGTSPEMVSEMALAVSKGLQSRGVLSCFKHFPGHGATVGDTHEGFAYTEKTLEQLKAAELKPFEAAVKADVPFVMVAHIAVPAVTGDETPASLSSRVMTDILREDMGYGGLIVTDALNMGAIVNAYESDEAAVMALKAGADVLLMPADFEAAYNGILNAVASGTVDETRIEASVRRILTVKMTFGDGSFVPESYKIYQ